MMIGTEGIVVIAIVLSLLVTIIVKQRLELKQKRERLEWFVDIMENIQANMPEGYRFCFTINKECQPTYYLMRKGD